jgi:hypothetical protein
MPARNKHSSLFGRQLERKKIITLTAAYKTFLSLSMLGESKLGCLSRAGLILDSVMFVGGVPVEHHIVTHFKDRLFV